MWCYQKALFDRDSFSQFALLFQRQDFCQVKQSSQFFWQEGNDRLSTPWEWALRMRDVSRGEERPAFFLEGKCFGKLLGFCQQAHSWSQHAAGSGVCLAGCGCRGRAVAALRWSRGAPSMAALLFSHSTVCCRIQDCKRKKITSGEGHLYFNRVTKVLHCSPFVPSVIKALNRAVTHLHFNHINNGFEPIYSASHGEIRNEVVILQNTWTALKGCPMHWVSGLQPWDKEQGSSNLCHKSLPGNPANTLKSAKLSSPKQIMSIYFARMFIKLYWFLSVHKHISVWTLLHSWHNT